MLTLHTRRNISLVLFVSLMLLSAAVWAMDNQEVGLQDGKYSGQAQGFGGLVVVDLTIADGKITDLEVQEHGETPFIADPAIETILENILLTQSSDVDIVAGATITSEAVMNAVKQALQKASPGFTDGVYVQTVGGFAGPIKVEVTVNKGSITNVVVLDNSETPSIAGEALVDIPAAIVANQTWEVDVVGGATVTSNAIMEAVEAALTE